METAFGLHGFLHDFHWLWKSFGNRRWFPQDFHRLWKSCETGVVSSCFHMISTGCGNHVETCFGFHGFPEDFHSVWKSSGNQCWFPRVSTGFPQAVDIQWKPLLVSTGSRGSLQAVETSVGFPQAVDPVESAFGFYLVST